MRQTHGPLPVPAGAGDAELVRRALLRDDASITTGPIFFSTISRSVMRARCSRVFTVSGSASG